MSIANDIRDAVMYDHRPLMDNDLFNRILSTFMRKGEWLDNYGHALTFALFVAEALDGGAGGLGLPSQAALDSPSIDMPPGLSREEKRQFIVSHASGVKGLYGEGIGGHPPMTGEEK